MMTPSPQPPSHPLSQAETQGSSTKVVEFAKLADGASEVWIELAGITYRLRKTRQGKLILTK